MDKTFTLKEVFELAGRSLFAYFNQPVTLQVEDKDEKMTSHHISALTLVYRALGEELVDRWGQDHAEVRKAMEDAGIDEEQAFPDETKGGLGVIWGRGRRRKTQRRRA